MITIDGFPSQQAELRSFTQLIMITSGSTIAVQAVPSY